jgi:phage gp36-like protein
VAYCIQTDLENAFGATLIVELTDDSGTGSADAARVARAIADADATIDAHLRAHYDVPLATTPDLIRKLSKDLAIFVLYQRRAAAFEMPEWMLVNHRDAMTMLGLIRKGEVDLGVEPPPAASSAEVATSEGPTRLFTTDTMEDF